MTEKSTQFSHNSTGWSKTYPIAETGLGLQHSTDTIFMVTVVALAFVDGTLAVVATLAVYVVLVTIIFASRVKTGVWEATDEKQGKQSEIG